MMMHWQQDDKGTNKNRELIQFILNLKTISYYASDKPNLHLD
jgi:hypothetical protein